VTRNQNVFKAWVDLRRERFWAAEVLYAGVASFVAVAAWVVAGRTIGIMAFVLYGVAFAAGVSARLARNHRRVRHSATSGNDSGTSSG
jgi:hypothetical protein